MFKPETPQSGGCAYAGRAQSQMPGSLMQLDTRCRASAPGACQKVFRFLKRDSDLDHTLTGLTPGSTVAAYVIAANPGGEAAPSPTVTKVVGA